VQRQADRDQITWEKRLWHLGNQNVACQPDAEAALAKTCQRLPTRFAVEALLTSYPTYPTRGRPRQDAATTATSVWQIQATLTRDAAALEREELRRAAYIIGTNLLDEAVIGLYREQSVEERGFTFLTDPLFLAFSVSMTLCLLIYKLAEVRVRHQLAVTGQTVPDQLRKPTARPTLRWLFQCFEGIDLHHTQHPDGTRSTEVLRLTLMHRLVLHLLGPTYENCYLVFQETAE
jgi:transposase